MALGVLFGDTAGTSARSALLYSRRSACARRGKTGTATRHSRGLSHPNSHAVLRSQLCRADCTYICDRRNWVLGCGIPEISRSARVGHEVFRCDHRGRGVDFHVTRRLAWRPLSQSLARFLFSCFGTGNGRRISAVCGFPVYTLSGRLVSDVCVGLFHVLEYTPVKHCARERYPSQSPSFCFCLEYPDHSPFWRCGSVSDNWLYRRPHEHDHRLSFRLSRDVDRRCGVVCWSKVSTRRYSSGRSGDGLMSI